MVRNWHKDRGWRDVGYHFFIRKNGEIQKGRPLNQIGAHTYGYNSDSIGICLSGLTDFRPPQFQALKDLVEDLNIELGTNIIPTPHNKYTKFKTCPNFDISKALTGSHTPIMYVVTDYNKELFDLNEEEFV